MNLNRAELIGNITQNPEVKKTATGKDLVSFSLATNYKYKNQKGEAINEPEFHNCVVFGKMTEVFTKYVKKGDKLFIDGRLKTSYWDDQSGNKRNKTTIIVQNMIMLGGKPKSGNAQTSDTTSQPEPQSNEPEINVEDIPF